MTDKKLMTYGPISFQKYIEDHKLPRNTPTARNISIDNIARLDRSLRMNNMMVFRLGSPEGERYTHFALVKSISNLESDYFVVDQDVFNQNEAELFIPTATYRQLFPFTLLPRFTETSVVNLCIASGLLSYALNLDKSELPSVPATGQGTYSFKVKPHFGIDVLWKRTKGQVEIDAIITATRASRPMLFLIESKSSTKLDSLAKHKLMYPLLALLKTVPPYIKIIPVYIRAIMGNEETHVYIAECETDYNRSEIPTIAGLTVSKAKHFIMRPIYGMSGI